MRYLDGTLEERFGIMIARGGRGGSGGGGSGGGFSSSFGGGTYGLNSNAYEGLCIAAWGGYGSTVGGIVGTIGGIFGTIAGGVIGAVAGTAIGMDACDGINGQSDYGGSSAR